MGLFSSAFRIIMVCPLPVAINCVNRIENYILVCSLSNLVGTPVYMAFQPILMNLFSWPLKRTLQEAVSLVGSPSIGAFQLTVIWPSYPSTSLVCLENCRSLIMFPSSSRHSSDIGRLQC